MFENHPINIITNSMGEESLKEKIRDIKDVFLSGITLDLFFEVITNIGNGTTPRFPPQRKSFDLGGWVKDFASYKIGIDENQLIIIFEYIIKHHVNTISQRDKQYTLIQSPDKDNFELEYIVLYALGV